MEPLLRRPIGLKRFKLLNYAYVYYTFKYLHFRVQTSYTEGLSQLSIAISKQCTNKSYKYIIRDASALGKLHNNVLGTLRRS